MNKMEKLFNSCKGILVFYIIVAVLSLLITKKVEDINSQAKKIIEQETYYA